MWICQLGDGYMLKREGSNLYRVYTGYPYPDTDKPQTELLYDIYYELFLSDNYKLREFIVGDSLSGVYYSKAIEHINQKLANRDYIDVLDLYAKIEPDTEVEFLGEYENLYIYRVPYVTKYKTFCKILPYFKDDDIYAYLITDKSKDLSMYNIVSSNKKVKTTISKYFLNSFYNLQDCYLVPERVALKLDSINEFNINENREVADLEQIKLKNIYSLPEYSIYLESVNLDKLANNSRAYIIASNLFRKWDLDVSLHDIAKRVVLEHFSRRLVMVLDLNKRIKLNKSGVCVLKVPSGLTVDECLSLTLNYGEVPAFRRHALFKLVYSGSKNGSLLLDFKKYVNPEDLDYVYQTLFYSSEGSIDGDIVCELETKLNITHDKLVQLAFLEKYNIVGASKRCRSFRNSKHPEMLSFLLNLERLHRMAVLSGKLDNESYDEFYYCYEYDAFQYLGYIVDVPKFIEKIEYIL